MKRHVHASQRTVTVEDGTVRDLDGNVLGEVERVMSGAIPRGWAYRPGSAIGWDDGLYRTQPAAVAALLADPSCPAGGPNLYDREARRG